MAAPPALLRVERVDDRLVFQLYEQGACLGERSIPYDPADAREVSQRFAALFARAVALNPLHDADLGRQTALELAELGRHVTQHYLPKRLYPKIAAGAGQAMIISHKLPLLGIPWELALVEEEYMALAMRLSRQLVVPDLTQPLTGASETGPCRLLFVVNPTGDLREAQCAAEQLFERVRLARPDVAISWVARDRVNRMDLLRRLERADLVYFVGHCEHDPNAPANGGWPLAHGRVSCADFRQMKSPPRFMFANGCETCREDSSPAPRMPGGVASSLLIPGVQGYIGSRWAIPERAGARFAGRFFGHLLAGQSAGEALRRSRKDEVREFGLQSMLWAGYVHIGFPDEEILPPSGMSMYA